MIDGCRIMGLGVARLLDDWISLFFLKGGGEEYATLISILYLVVMKYRYKYK